MNDVLFVSGLKSILTVFLQKVFKNLLKSFKKLISNNLRVLTLIKKNKNHKLNGYKFFYRHDKEVSS